MMSKDNSLEQHVHFSNCITCSTFPFQTQYLNPLFSCKTTSLSKSLHPCFSRQPLPQSSFWLFLLVSHLNWIFKLCSFFLWMSLVLTLPSLFPQPLFRCSLLSLDLATNQKITGMVFSEVLSVFLQYTVLFTNVQWCSLVCQMKLKLFNLAVSYVWL